MSAPSVAPEIASGNTRLPRRVVALGGGTGLPVVLRGLRGLIRGEDRTALTAVVTMSDDGGSSGRLRNSMGHPPPGDVRNCLVALSENEELLASLFQHRFTGSKELSGHTAGNLILVALAEQMGGFLKAVEASSMVLRTAGRILPATQDDVRLEAALEDGSRIVGETKIDACGGKIDRILLQPASARPTPGVLEAIERADLVVLGPGSLYTSLVPNVIVRGIGEALCRTSASVVLVANLVSERGEASGLDLADHLDVLEKHAGGKFIDGILAHEGPVDADVRERYRTEGATVLTSKNLEAVHVMRCNLLAGGRKLRHDPAATAEGLIAMWDALSSKSNPQDRTTHGSVERRTLGDGDER